MNKKQSNSLVTGTIAPQDVRKSGASPLQEAAQRIAEYARNQGRYKAKELVALLSSHGDRSARIGRPAVNIHLYITADKTSKTPVNLRLR